MPLNSTHRQAASRLLANSTDILSFAAAWGVGAAVDRALASNVPGRLAVVLGCSLAGALVADELLYVAAKPLRESLREPASEAPVLPATLDEACRALAVDTVGDAARRAALRAMSLDLSGGLLGKSELWTGYKDGNAALILAPGAAVFCRHVEGFPRYELALAGVREPVELSSMAQLLKFLPTGTALVEGTEEEPPVQDALEQPTECATEVGR